MSAPPRLAEWLLSASIPAARARDGILGDLAEEYDELVGRLGDGAARRWYWTEAVRLMAWLHWARLRPNSDRRRGRRAWWAGERMADEPRGRLSPLRDLRFACRALGHQPALSATIVVTLAAALAANATIFAIGDALVLRPFRFPGLERAAVISSTGHERFFARESVAPGDFLDWRERTTGVFEHLAAIESWDVNASGDGVPEQIPGFRVTANLFTVLDARPVLGRFWTSADERASPLPVVIGHGFWTRRFAADPNVVGRTIRLDGNPHVIVGVAPATFRAPFGADLWAPLVFGPEAREARERGWLMVTGRLRPGVSVAAAEGRMQAVLADQRRAYPETHAARQVSVHTFRDGFGDPGAGPFVMVWQLAALLLLMVASANIANLLLARGVEREREFAVRLALGAGRARLAWQMLLEGFVLAVVAAALALPLAWAALQALRAAMPAAIVRFVTGWEYLQVEPRTFLVTCGLAAATCAVFAAAPAWRATRADIADGLRSGGRGNTDAPRRARGRTILAVAQTAVTLALLTAAGLSVAALARVTSGPLGFDPDSVLTGAIVLPQGRYEEHEQRRQMIHGVLERVSGSPAVTGAAITTSLPYGGGNETTQFWLPESDPTPAGAEEANLRRVSAGFFEVLRVPLVRGRLPGAADREDALPVAVVSESLARDQWPGREAVGQRIRLRPDGPWITVVGVVGDVRHDWIVNVRQPTVYRPMAQDPPRSFYVAVRTVSDPMALAADLRGAAQALDSDQPVSLVRSLETVIEDKTVGLRIAGRTLTTIALLSLALAVLGVYSLLSFVASRRSKEFGVRLALGATTGDVVRLTMRQAASLTAGGLVAGGLLAYGVGLVLERSMFGVVEADPLLTLAIAVMLAAAALVAGYVAARRAASVDPVQALRAE